MKHRHLDHQDYTLAAIDDVISRGLWADWADLRRAALADPSIMKKIEQICRVYASDPSMQRYRFWSIYAAKHRTAS